jgi:CDP-diglyceride synthetase
MNQVIIFLLVVIGLFAIMLALMEIGRRIGVQRLRQDVAGVKAGLGVIEGAVFGLMGLVVAFTFSGAATRLDARRQLIGQETNAIGTAYLRIDLLPATSQPLLRDDFRMYVDARLGYFKSLSSDDAAAAKTELDKSIALQGRIWSKAVAGCEKAGSPSTTSLVLSSLNEMIDITTTRAVALEMHPPRVVFWGLAVLVLASALLAGYGMAEARTRSWLHMLIYSAILAVAVYVILDLEYPRVGFIRIDAADHVLLDLRNSMK